MKRFTITVISLCCAHVWAENSSAIDTTSLPTIEVNADAINKPFLTPSAASHIQMQNGRDMNDVLRSSPGLFTQHDIGQGGVAVNMRGLEGMGRVNTMVDGVSQTFNPNSRPGHGWSANTVYLDEDFIAGVDVERGLSQGANGGNALGGSVNFRTIAPEDVVEKGNQWGGRFTLRRGTNGYRNNGMAALAYRHELDNGGSVGALAAYSRRIKGGYKNGAGEMVAGDDAIDASTNELPMESGVHARNMMGKIEFAPNRHHSFKLSYLGSRSHMHNNHLPVNITGDSGLLQYRYKPLSDWVDLHADLSYSNTQQYMEREEYETDESAHASGWQNRKSYNPTWSFGLSNRSNIELGKGDLSLNYGGKLLRTRYKVDESEFDGFDPLEPESRAGMLVKGGQNIGNLFAEGEYQYGKWTLGAGLRYENYQFMGHIPPSSDEGKLIMPPGGDADFKRREKHFNPYFNVGYQALDWLQLYASYAHTSRSPNVREIMYINNGYNSPFSVNPYLKSEQAVNRDIGFNIFKQGWFKHDDVARLKVNYFNNRVKNYIYQEQMYLCADYTKCTLDDLLNDPDNYGVVGLYMNMPKITKIRGWEIEGGYDFGRGYVNLTYSRSKTDTPEDSLIQIGGAPVRTQPDSQLVLDAGTRWLDNRLTLGARLTRMGNDTVGLPYDSEQTKQTGKVKGGKVIYDLYAHYQISKHAKLFLNIENLTNTVYNYPLSGGTMGTGNNDPDNMNTKGTGRGRTIYGGFSLKF